MTKTKKVVSGLLIALVALTLISFCFLGSTFARYTSDGNVSATAQIAKWDVSAGEGDATVTFDKLAPDPKAYTNTTRTSTKVVPVATITNNGDVDAIVTVALDGALTAWQDEKKYEATTVEDGAYTAEDVIGLFKVEFFADKECMTEFTGQTLAAKKVDTAAATLTIYARITWTSNDTDSAKDNGEAADKLDTWVGQNITSIKCSFKWTAVQETEA